MTAHVGAKCEIVRQKLSRCWDTKAPNLKLLCVRGPTVFMGRFIPKFVGKFNSNSKNNTTAILVVVFETLFARYNENGFKIKF